MATYKRLSYLLMTTDPVHIGTGGYRLGGVDNTIVREPGTRIPKIPGTSLHGAIRSYAAKLYETPEAAGQSQESIENPDKNPVCYTFGYVKKENNGDTRAYSGIINIFDAHILLFPVYSMAGPVWVSTKERLQDAGFTIDDLPESWDKDTVYLTWERQEPLNLGWMMLKVAGKRKIEAPQAWEGDQWDAIKDHIVLVQSSLFTHIVNSNLEVRTSVAIDPATGAAEEGALFTYEAIPRATFLTMDVVMDDYRDNFPSKNNLGNWLNEIAQKFKDDNLESEKKKQLQLEKAAIKLALEHIDKLNIEKVKNWSNPLDVVEAGLKMLQWLGVGGMGTRGFGRIAIVGKPVEKKCDREGNNG